MDDKALQAALWYKQLCESNNAVFLPLFFDHHRHLILMGGGGSGKSIFAGRKVLERCATEPGHRMLVVRKVAKTLRESCFDQLKAQAMQYYGPAVKMIPRGKSGDMYITFTNGSEILFAGLDDVEKLKSIHDISGIWIEGRASCWREILISWTSASAASANITSRSSSRLTRSPSHIGSKSVFSIVRMRAS